jgi:nucleotide-binding universal stress UspA family protein
MALSQFTNPSWAVPRDVVRVKFSPDRAPRVLCATDLGVGSDAALSRARQIARALGAQLHLLHVVDSASTARATGRRRARTQLTIDALSRKIAWPGSVVQGSVRASRLPHRAIADVAIEWDADLIVLGRYRRRLGDSFRGTTAERVIRNAGRPVLVVNRDATGPYEHVLLASDLSRMTAGIARVSKQLGLLAGSRTSVVHVPQHSLGLMLYLARGSESAVSNNQRSRSRFAAEQIEAQLERAGLSGAQVTVFSPQTSPLHAIEQAAQPAGSDLVVVGSSRFPLLKRLFIGSVSNEVLRGIKHDILLVSPAAARRAKTRESRHFPDFAVRQPHPYAPSSSASGTAPDNNIASWNLRMSNLAPSTLCARVRSARKASFPNM